jgi:hypothetical protein
VHPAAQALKHRGGVVEVARFPEHLPVEDNDCVGTQDQIPTGDGGHALGLVFRVGENKVARRQSLHDLLNTGWTDNHLETRPRKEIAATG